MKTNTVASIGFEEKLWVAAGLSSDTRPRYVGTEITEEDDEVFDEKMEHLTAKLNQQFEQSKELEQKIKENLKKLQL